MGPRTQFAATAANGCGKSPGCRLTSPSTSHLVRLALDDFGTGFSSLSYLRKLPIDIVKIDQSFIADIGEAPTGGAIVAAVTNLAHVLGLQVTAEGVETQVQRDEVRTIGCEAAQGFFYARPMPATAVTAHLQSVT